MFLQERSNHSSTNNLNNNNNNSNNPFEENDDIDAFTTPTTTVHHYDVPSHVISAQELSDKMFDKMSESKFYRPKNQTSVPEQSFPKFPFVHMDSRDSIYENGEQTVTTHLLASVSQQICFQSLKFLLMRSHLQLNIHLKACNILIVCYLQLLQQECLILWIKLLNLSPNCILFFLLVDNCQFLRTTAPNLSDNIVLVGVCSRKFEKVWNILR